MFFFSFYSSLSISFVLFFLVFTFALLQLCILSNCGMLERPRFQQVQLDSRPYSSPLPCWFSLSRVPPSAAPSPVVIAQHQVDDVDCIQGIGGTPR